MARLTHLLLMLLVVAGCAPPGPAPLTLILTGWPGDLGFVLVDRLGLDEANQLSLQLPRLETADDQIQAFRNGSSDVLNVTLDVAITLAAKDPDLRVFFAYNDSAGADGLVARDTIRSPVELRGRRVGAETGVTSHYLLQAILARAGLSIDEVIYVDVQADEVRGALERGEVDAVATWAPTLGEAAGLPGMHILSSSAEFPGLILNVLVARRPDLEAQPERYARLLRAWDEMRTICEADPERCWAELAADQGRPAEALAAEAAGIRFLRLADNQALFSAAGGPGSLQESLASTYAFLRATNPELPAFDPLALYEPSIVTAAAR